MEFEEDAEVMLHKAFSAPNILDNFHLDHTNIMQYFSESVFFDVNSINQIKRRGQSLETDQEGIEFTLIHSNAIGKNELSQSADQDFNMQLKFGIHIIKRVLKTKYAEIPQRIYYCIGTTFYQAPSFKRLILTKLENACNYLEENICQLAEMSRWSILTSYNWKATLNLDDLNLKIMDEKKDSDESKLIKAKITDTDEEDDEMNNSIVSSDFEESKETVVKPQFFHSVKLFKDDQTSILFSNKGYSKKIKIIQSVSKNYTADIMNDSFQQLYKANSRIANIYVNKAEENAKIIESRRTAIGSYFTALDRIEAEIFKIFYEKTGVVNDDKSITGVESPKMHI